MTSNPLEPERNRERGGFLLGGDEATALDLRDGVAREIFERSSSLAGARPAVLSSVPRG